MQHFIVIVQEARTNRHPPVVNDLRRACEHFIVVASKLDRAGRFTWTWNMRGTAHNMSYKAVLARFDFASKLVYQPGQECALQVATAF